MAFWDDFTKGAKDAASFTVKKTGELTAAAKLKVALHNEETKLSECFESMGKLYYEEKTADADNETAIEALIKSADETKVKIAELKDKLSDLKGACVCKKCGSTFDEEFEFCPKCGTKKETEE